MQARHSVNELDLIKHLIVRVTPNSPQRGLTLLTFCKRSSEFVEGLDIDGLHVVLKSFNLFCDVISRDLLVFDSGTNNNLVDTISDGFFLVLSLPSETILLDLEDEFSHFVEIGFLTPWLNFPNNDGFSDGFGFVEFTSFGSDRFHTFNFRFLSFFIFLLVGEGVEIIIILLFYLSGSSSSLGFNLGELGNINGFHGFIANSSAAVVVDDGGLSSDALEPLSNIDHSLAETSIKNKGEADAHEHKV